MSSPSHLSPNDIIPTTHTTLPKTMPENLRSDSGHEDATAGLPLDEYLILPSDDDDSSEEEVATDDSPAISVVYCRWGSCRKMFKPGVYLSIDLEYYKDHIKRDHVNPIHMGAKGKVKCLWEFNQCNQEISSDEILGHVQKHFEQDENTRDAYPDPTLTPKQWVYCLWGGCGKLFANQEIENILWGHIMKEHVPHDVTTGIKCEWIGCEYAEEEEEEEKEKEEEDLEPTTLISITSHVEMHLGNEIHFGITKVAGPERVKTTRTPIPRSNLARVPSSPAEL